jgi:hypothetical protein
MACMVATYFQKSTLSRVITKSLLQPQTSQKWQLIMPFGLFECLFMPFGLSNTAQTFQRMMDRTTDSLEGVFAYMFDSRVGSPDRQTYLCHLEAFFWNVCLHTWPTHVWVLQTGKHTSAIWKPFSTPWPPMVSPSVSENVSLQCPLWRFLAT